MSTTRCLWALAFFSTSALLLPPPPAGAAAVERSATELKLVELEGSLAKDPFVYLTLDPIDRSLDIRVRGIVIERVPLLELGFLTFAPFLGHGDVEPPLAPAIWTVVEGPGDTDREVIAPTALRPFPTTEEEAEADAQQTAQTKPDTDPDAKPSSYRVRLDNGWQLFVVSEVPDRGWWPRFKDAVRDGWLRLRGEEPGHPPLLTLVVSPESAHRLYHLFRAKMPILVGGGLATARPAE